MQLAELQKIFHDIGESSHGMLRHLQNKLDTRRLHMLSPGAKETGFEACFQWLVVRGENRLCSREFLTQGPHQLGRKHITARLPGDEHEGFGLQRPSSFFSAS